MASAPRFAGSKPASNIPRSLLLFDNGVVEAEAVFVVVSVFELTKFLQAPFFVTILLLKGLQAAGVIHICVWLSWRILATIPEVLNLVDPLLSYVLHMRIVLNCDTSNAISKLVGTEQRLKVKAITYVRSLSSRKGKAESAELPSSTALVAYDSWSTKAGANSLGYLARISVSLV